VVVVVVGSVVVGTAVVVVAIVDVVVGSAPVPRADEHAASRAHRQTHRTARLITARLRRVRR